VSSRVRGCKGRVLNHRDRRSGPAGANYMPFGAARNWRRPVVRARGSHVERLVNRVARWSRELLWARRTGGSALVRPLEQASGPRCQGWSARRATPEDERPLTVGWRLLRHPRARRVWWGAGYEACRTRQPVVDRATASLMYAGRDRRVYAQELAPLCVRLRWHRIAENVRGSGLRRRVAGASRKDRPWRASIGATVGRRWSHQVVVSSAQTNPASSRATAAVTVDWDCLRAARWRNRRHSRS
jgi:hypothetical protein